MKLIATILAALALTGCATGQYEAYTQATTAQALATANAQAERYKALASLANSGSDVAKVAAVMALAGHNTGSTPQATPIAAPRSAGDTALQWASIIVPTLGQAYAIGQNVKLGMRQSDNSAALGMSTNSAFVGMAGQIQAPAANVTTTLSGTGVLGSGSYSIGPNSGTNSGNSGRLAGSSITDNTHTPAIVTQPAPVVVRPEVVTQPVPAIVRPEVVRPEIVRPEVLPPTPTP
jgi:hypothetical protein